MEFKFAHNNINVLDLEKSMAFYEKARGQAIEYLDFEIALSVYKIG